MIQSTYITYSTYLNIGVLRITPDRLKDYRDNADNSNNAETPSQRKDYVMRRVIIIFLLVTLSGCSAHRGTFAVNANITPPDGFDSVSVAYSVDIGHSNHPAR